MSYQREQTYRRAVKALAREARRSDKWPERTPHFALSEIRDNLVILRDQRGEIASFRFTHRGTLKLIDY